ncbi:2-nonaprenyl-3-methyl-6-methoxy-1,4-benzoquinol hydroxylase [Thiomonas sp. X19]|uniref:2-polyprenyl-3-methyl-6-methoxy-1,4-benzoquinone monooxygenase n=1 Tax=Thiomonas sp. X19 TaxID=1050370 RepID=UPI000B723B40|nr:2-polyprenyl-3-methyl-6-methoxy-1,4-benzoquinone monooxygenase [Thiomonas sp. X19]SCC91468.1 2-nonaprenyl-3-methyl-6-methoxy-1,4-benzoquinol hydroxylase [Thiomonas sp. X19]
MVTIHRAEPASSARSRAPTHPRAVDRLLVAADNALKTLAGGLQPSRPMPAPPLARPAASQGTPLSLAERELSARLMRVNHVGEICAQALYQGQALAARDGQLRQHYLHASREEGDHLAWCAQRLRELDSRPSWLNPLWYAGAFGLGLLAGRVAGDKVSLGFVVETENQVEQHLASHLQRLPQADVESRAVVAQMQADEVEHARAADKLGAARLPAPVRWAMRGAAMMMTTTAQWV